MNVLKDIYDPAKEYGSIPFWGWNDKLEPEKLRVQIRRMKELGMNGFFMHEREDSQQSISLTSGLSVFAQALTRAFPKLIFQKTLGAGK